MNRMLSRFEIVTLAVSPPGTSQTARASPKMIAMLRRCLPRSTKSTIAADERRGWGCRRVPGRLRPQAGVTISSGAVIGSSAATGTSTAPGTTGSAANR